MRVEVLVVALDPVERRRERLVVPSASATSPTQSQNGTSRCRSMIRRAAAKSPWMSPRAPKTATQRLRRLGRHEQVGLVPDEVLVAVDGELVVLAHEDRRHRAGFFAVSAEDAARLVDLVDLRVARARPARCRRFPPPRDRSRRPGTPPRTGRRRRTSRGRSRPASAPVFRATSGKPGSSRRDN